MYSKYEYAQCSRAEEFCVLWGWSPQRRNDATTQRRDDAGCRFTFVVGSFVGSFVASLVRSFVVVCGCCLSWLAVSWLTSCCCWLSSVVRWLVDVLIEASVGRLKCWLVVVTGLLGG